MNSRASSYHVTTEELIGSATSLEEIVGALAKRGCEDLTSSINLGACSKLPVAGGGFCDVFMGELQGGAKVAIKTLRIYEKPGQDDEKQKALKRAAREVYCWSRLNHPNVLRLRGHAVFNGHMSMISEWMENGDLRSYVRLNPKANRLDLCFGVSEGLCYIHAKGMVHGDLKAANVMVSRSGVPQITDFGNSQLKDATLNFTETNSYSHSARWTSPELLDNQGGPHASKEADVYAYGMTTLEVMTGEVPFQGISDHQVIMLVGVKKQFPRREVAISDDLWGVLTRCWAQAPAQRPLISDVRRQIGDLIINKYTKAIAANPNEPVHLMNRAASYMTIKKFTHALADYQKVASLQSASPVPDTLLRLAYCHLARGCGLECIAVLRDLPDSTPGVSDARRRAEQLESHLQRFEDARDKDEWGAARSALGRAIEMLGGNIPVQWACWRVECEIAKGNWAEAYSIVGGTLQQNPNSVDLLSLRGLVMFLTNQISEAIQYAQRALRLDPNHNSAQQLLQRARGVERFGTEGNMLFKAGRLGEAVDRYGEALKAVGQRTREGGGGPLRAVLLSNRATVQLKLNQLESALEDTNASLALNPNSYQALRTRARISVSLEYFEDALRDFKAARESAEGTGAAQGKHLRSLDEEIENAEVKLEWRSLTLKSFNQRAS